MNPVLYLNTILGTGLIILLVSIDYIRKYNTDKHQRMFFLIVLGAMMFSIITELTGVIINYSEPKELAELPSVYSLMLIFRTIGNYTALLFADYLIFGDINRTKKFFYAILAVLVIFIILVLMNNQIESSIPNGTNSFQSTGKFYILEQIISHLPILICIINRFSGPKNSKRINLPLLFFFCLFTGMGSLADLLLKSSGLEWFCFTAAVLYIYFFIIRQDSKIDALTGIGNRYSFNEFIESLSKRNRKKNVFNESWAIVMIDMDHFKEINDKLGHMEGDNALIDMAKIIRGCIRRSDFAACYGGDEFVLAARAETDIERLIARLRRDLDRFNEITRRPYRLEISYGYDIFTTGGTVTMDEFLAHIDNLMYRHKAQQRRTTDKKND